MSDISMENYAAVAAPAPRPELKLSPETSKNTTLVPEAKKKTEQRGFFSRLIRREADTAQASADPRAGEKAVHKVAKGQLGTDTPNQFKLQDQHNPNFDMKPQDTPYDLQKKKETPKQYELQQESTPYTLVDHRTGKPMPPGSPRHPVYHRHPGRESQQSNQSSERHGDNPLMPDRNRSQVDQQRRDEHNYVHNRMTEWDRAHPSSQYPDIKVKQADGTEITLYQQKRQEAIRQFHDQAKRHAHDRQYERTHPRPRPEPIAPNETPQARKARLDRDRQRLLSWMDARHTSFNPQKDQQSTRQPHSQQSQSPRPEAAPAAPGNSSATETARTASKPTTTASAQPGAQPARPAESTSAARTPSGEQTARQPTAETSPSAPQPETASPRSEALTDTEREQAHKAYLRELMRQWREQNPAPSKEQFDGNELAYDLAMEDWMSQEAYAIEDAQAKAEVLLDMKKWDSEHPARPDRGQNPEAYNTFAKTRERYKLQRMEFYENRKELKKKKRQIEKGNLQEEDEEKKKEEAKKRSAQNQPRMM